MEEKGRLIRLFFEIYSKKEDRILKKWFVQVFFLLLLVETPDSLSKQYSAQCEFTFAELYGLYVWRIDLCVWQNGRRLNLYSIQVDAVSGQLFSIRSFGSFYAYDTSYDYDVPKLPEQYWEQAP